VDVIITSVTDVSIFDIERDLVNGALLGRRVQILDTMPLSGRNLKARLLDIQEMLTLRAEPRILQVERLEEMAVRAVPKLDLQQVITPVLSSSAVTTHTNWALDYCSNDVSSSFYTYSHAGEGVDVVIMDTGIRATHNEFKDVYGTSRVQLIEWKAGQFTSKPAHYTDSNGHGTHVAGIAAGLVQGWAKKAHIYVIKIFDTGAYDYLEALQLIRTWHLSKTTGRPTVVNMSWGFTTNFPSNYPDATLAGKSHPIRVASVDAEVEDLIAAGVVVVSSSGNDSAYVANSNEPAYNDYYMTNASYQYVSDPAQAVYVYYYKRKTPAGANNVICVGSNGDITTTLEKDRASYFSNIGPRINIFAPGLYIQSASNLSDSGLLKKAGTSMSSPQTTGIVAIYLSMAPRLSLSRLNQMLTVYGKHDILPSSTIQGSANLVLRSLYNGVRVKHQGVWKTALPFVFNANSVAPVKKVLYKNASVLKRVLG
jgi:subtilisin family serine protease